MYNELLGLYQAAQMGQSLYGKGKSLYDKSKGFGEDLLNPDLQNPDFGGLEASPTFMAGRQKLIGAPGVEAEANALPPVFAGQTPAFTPPPQMFGTPDVGGVELGTSLAQREESARAQKEAAERADFASRGFNYYAPGIGYKGELKGGGTVSMPTAKGSSFEQEQLHRADMEEMSRAIQMGQAQQALQSASLTPQDLARNASLAKTQYRIDPVKQQAWKMGQRMVAQKQAAMAKALADSAGDAEKFAAAKARIDETFGELDYSNLLAWTLGQRAVEGGYGAIE